MQTPQDIILKNKAKYIETEILPHLLKIIQRFADLLPPISSIDDYAKEIFNNPEDGGSILLLETFKKELTNFTAEFIGFLQNTYVDSNQNKSIQDLISLVKIDINVLVHGLDKAIDEHISNSETYNSRYLIFKKIVIYFNAIGYCLAGMREEIEGFKNKLLQGEYDLENSLKKIETIIDVRTAEAQIAINEIVGQSEPDENTIQQELSDEVQEANIEQAPQPMDLELPLEKIPLELIVQIATFLDPEALYNFSRTTHLNKDATVELMKAINEILRKPECRLVDPKILFKNLNNNPQAIKLFFAKKPNKIELEKVLQVNTTELVEAFNADKWQEIQEKFAQSNPLLLVKLNECYSGTNSTLSYILQLMALVASNYQMIHLLPVVANYYLDHDCLGFKDCLKSWAKVEGLPIIEDDQVKQAAVLLKRLDEFWMHRNSQELKQRLKEWVKKEGYDFHEFDTGHQGFNKQKFKTDYFYSCITTSILKLPPGIAKSDLPKWIRKVLGTQRSIPPLEKWTLKEIKRLKEIPCESLPQLIDDEEIEKTLQFIQLFKDIPLELKEVKILCEDLRFFAKKDILEIFQKQSDLVAFHVVRVQNYSLSNFVSQVSNNKFLTSLLKKYRPGELSLKIPPAFAKLALFFESIQATHEAAQIISNIDFNVFTILETAPYQNNLSFLDLLLHILKNLINSSMLLSSNKAPFLRALLEFFAKFNLELMQRFLVIMDGREELIVKILQGLAFDGELFGKLLQDVSYRNESTCSLNILRSCTSSPDLIILLVKHCAQRGIIDLERFENTQSFIESLVKYDNFIIEILIKSLNQSDSTANKIQTIQNQLREKQELLLFLVKSLPLFSETLKSRFSANFNPLQTIEVFWNKKIKLGERLLSFLEALISLPQPIGTDNYSLQSELARNLFPTIVHIGDVVLYELGQQRVEEVSQYLPVLLNFSNRLITKVSGYRILDYLNWAQLASLFKIKEQSGQATEVSLLEAFLYLLPKVDLGLPRNLVTTLMPFLEQNQSKIFAIYNKVKKAEQAMAPVTYLNQPGKPPSVFFPPPKPQQGNNTGFVPRQMSLQEQQLSELFIKGFQFIKSPNVNVSSDQYFATLQKLSSSINGIVNQLAQQHSSQIPSNNSTQNPNKTENKRKDPPDPDEADKTETKKSNTSGTGF